MRALITGADGFVGRHLMAHLQAMEDDVVATDRGLDGLDLVDETAVRDLIDRVRPDALYHLGGWSDVGSSWSAPRAALEANALGTLSVLTGCAAVGVGRVLVVTSADVYGSTTEADLPLTEDAPLRPVSPYAASKAAAEMLCVQAHLGWGVDVLRARAFNHIGPGQSPAFAAPAFASRIVDAERSGTGVVRVGNLLARRDITDVRDVVRAYRSLIESGTAGEAYNVCTGTDVAMSDIIDLLISLANCPLQIEHDPDLDRPVDVPARRGDPTKINAATGWQPRIPFQQSVCDVLDDVRTRRAAAATLPQRER